MFRWFTNGYEQNKVVIDGRYYRTIKILQYVKWFVKTKWSAGSPSLIVLDLNMAMKDGRNALKHLKASKDFKHIPVVILSTSKSHLHVLQGFHFTLNNRMAIVMP